MKQIIGEFLHGYIFFQIKVEKMRFSIKIDASPQEFF